MSPRPGRFPLALDRLGASPNEAAPTTPRVSPAQGLGLDSQAVRERMVSRLRQQGIACEPVLVAMARVPRHAFVDGALAAQAYENTALPIGHGQTISQPWVVARMIELLFAVRPAAATSLGRVLEIGTGCGYQAAVLSCVAASVVSIERMRALFDRARENLAALRADNLRLVYGDGRLGHAPNAPYDSILCAAGGDDIPRKRGPGVVQADLLVINKTDLHPYVGVDLPRMVAEASAVRGGRPLLCTNCRADEGVDRVADALCAAVLRR